MDDTPGRVRNGGGDLTDRATQQTRSDAEQTGDIDERTREIRNQIEETRVEMTETIDAIQDKLNPRNIVASATSRVKDVATQRVREMADTASQTAQQAMDYTRETASDITERARQNPIPLALIGVGAAWLLANRSRRPSYRSDGVRGGQREYAGEWTRDQALNRDPSEDGLMANIRNNPIPAALAGIGLGWLAFASGQRGDRRDAGRWGAASREGREGWAGQPEGASGESGVVQNLTESTSQIASRTREYATETAESMRRMARRRQNQLQRMVQENPVLVGAGALMIGAAFGMAVPKSDAEDELMGEARDTVVGRAREMAREAATKVQSAASSVVDAAGTVAEKTQP